MTVISLKENNLSGTLPDELVNLTKLREFHVESNHISGPISREQWGLLGQVRFTFLNDNRFKGPLPDDIGEILSDETLNFEVRGNEFSGTIPASLALLPQLGQIDVSHNLFTGTIPENLTANTLFLPGNYFTGTIPDSVCRGVDSIFYDCTGFLSCTCDECFCVRR